VEAAFPDAVVRSEHGYKLVDYAGLVAAMIEAVKELAERVAAEPEGRGRRATELPRDRGADALCRARKRRGAAGPANREVGRRGRQGARHFDRLRCAGSETGEVECARPTRRRSAGSGRHGGDAHGAARDGPQEGSALRRPAARREQQRRDNEDS
jgi:hypothetical protein